MRTYLATVLFLSIGAAAYAVCAMLTYEDVIWRWPASFQVAWVFSTVILTAVMYGMLGFSEPDDMEQFDDRR